MTVNVNYWSRHDYINDWSRYYVTVNDWISVNVNYWSRHDYLNDLATTMNVNDWSRHDYVNDWFRHDYV